VKEWKRTSPEMRQAELPGDCGETGTVSRADGAEPASRQNDETGRRSSQVAGKRIGAAAPEAPTSDQPHHEDATRRRHTVPRQRTAAGRRHDPQRNEQPVHRQDLSQPRRPVRHLGSR